MTLHVPDITPDHDTVSAALAYIEAGWYVLPLSPEGKHAGSVLGKGWPDKTSRDPQTVVAWFAGSNDLLALHVGRSGAIAFDVDKPALMPAELRALAGDAAFQSTRADEVERGHYLYAVPPGRMFGNGGGRLGSKWGEVRGRNGIIVVSPSLHPHGGRYEWARTGPLATLPEELAALLPDGSPGEGAVTDAEVRAFLDKHDAFSRPELLTERMDRIAKQVQEGAARHVSTLRETVLAFKEAAAGYYPAGDAYSEIQTLFEHLATRQHPRDPTGHIRTAQQARAEFHGIAAWAVGQASRPEAVAEARTWVETNRPQIPPFVYNPQPDATPAPPDRDPRDPSDLIAPAPTPTVAQALPTVDDVTDEHILSGLYADASTARAHFIEAVGELDGNDPKPPPLNVSTMLPARMRTFVQNVAEHLQVPAEAPALVAISVLSTATGGRVVVDGRNGWTQSAQVWTTTTMHSGERKTDVVRLAAAPLRQIERRLIAEHLDKVKNAQKLRGELMGAEKDLKKDLKGAKGSEREQVEQDLDDVRKALEDLPDETRPMPALLVEDITVEALSQRLDENGQALGVISDEGGLFSLISGRYSKDKAPNLDLYLKSYDQSPVRVDRVQRGSIMLTRPSLAIGLLVQPHVLDKAASIDGAMERGLMGRFWFAVPESTMGKRLIDTPALHSTIADDWNTTVTYAYNLRTTQEDVQHVVGIDDGAHQLLRGLRMHLEPHLEPIVGRYAHMTDWAGKLAGKVLRLAVIFHLADGHAITRPIDEVTMNQAIAFGLWALKHAEHVYAAWRSNTETTAPGVAWVLGWLERTGREEFTVRDAQQAAKRATSWYSKEALHAALCELVRARLLSSHARLDGAGRRQKTGAFIVRSDR
ncbi:DUF3987 domain-containing protein [Streptosporangium sp. NBC_01810]|uniref:DUF3987 domain-containing protein n=1 Tax=Streptosporangium sp. NBC_01810 TaxID=2975951 RepID=UPI002DDAE36E|nr:DUF3987 domain-containing protein [Streptosporangium sp. NBC_01810]WSA29423.1 DUF3987 domain-containing protein [Streptosporangium sp. NBC_01810]